MIEDAPSVPWACAQCGLQQETPGGDLSWHPSRPDSVEVECEGCHTVLRLPYPPGVEIALAHGMIDGLRSSTEAATVPPWCGSSFIEWADRQLSRINHPSSSWDPQQELQQWK